MTSAGDRAAAAATATGAAASDPPASTADAASDGALRFALAGAVALAVAMGIGRFAFTPLLPMMLADATIDLHGASWLASANYLGYLVGALLCTLQPWIWSRAPSLPPLESPRLVRVGLAATGALTLGMALPWPGAWPALRFLAGMASSLVFVYGSAWCLGQLARHGASRLGGVMFMGPGAGIVVSGLFASALVAWHARAAVGWFIFGLLASALGAGVWRTFRSERTVAGGSIAGATSRSASKPSTLKSSALPKAPEPESFHGAPEIALLAFTYGLAGLGYIVTATFLPVIARAALPASPWLDFFWPIFGAGVIVGALLSSRMRMSGDMRLLIAGAYVIQAIGIAASLVSPTLAGFAVGSLLLGLPFTAITFFAMQEVRRVRPLRAAGTTGLLTVVWSLGQIAGPPLASAMVRRTGSAAAGFTLALEIAVGVLVFGALLCVAMSRLYPMRAASNATPPSPMRSPAAATIQGPRED